MNYINVAALVPLANTAVAALAEKFGAVTAGNAELAAEIKKQMAENRAAQVEEAAAEIIALTNAKSEFLMSQAGVITDLQNRIKGVEGLMASIDKASQYGDATGNYLPLASMLGYDIPAGSREFAKMPKDWTAPTADTTQASASA